MTNAFDNPLARALSALDRLQSPDMNLAAAAAWQEARDALLEGMKQRGGFVAVVHRAIDLIDALDGYEDALEAGDEGQIDKLAEAGTEAEEALVEALNEVLPDTGTDADLSGDAQHLAALNRFSDDTEGDNAARAQAYRDAFDEEDKARK